MGGIKFLFRANEVKAFHVPNFERKIVLDPSTVLGNSLMIS